MPFFIMFSRQEMLCVILLSLELVSSRKRIKTKKILPRLKTIAERFGQECQISLRVKDEFESHKDFFL